MRAAVIQFNATADKEKNVERALKLVKEAIGGGAEFILLPEAFHFRGKPDGSKGYRDIAEDIPGASTKPFLEVARKHKVSILAGSICEKARGSRKVSNTSVLIGADGRIAARYRKKHLFNADIGDRTTNESQFFRPGKRNVMAKIGDWNVGLSICFDIRFTDLYRAYARKGAHILCVPSSFTKVTGRDHWEVLLRARAIENFCYVLAPNQVGKDGNGIASYGNSMIVDSWGKIIARASADKEEVLFARLDKGLIAERRKTFRIHK